MTSDWISFTCRDRSGSYRRVDNTIQVIVGYYKAGTQEEADILAAKDPKSIPPLIPDGIELEGPCNTRFVARYYPRKIFFGVKTPEYWSIDYELESRVCWVPHEPALRPGLCGL